MIPGRVLQRLAAALCSVSMRERVVDALIADCQHEWLSADNLTGRLLVFARCWSSFWMALAGCLAHDVRYDTFGFAKRVVAPAVSVGFWAAVGLIMLGGRSWVRNGTVDPAELWRNITLMSAYLPAVVIAIYRNKKCQRRSWSGLAWSLGLMGAFLIFRDVFSEYRFILGWAAGSCVSASWTFLVKKDPSVVKASN